MKNKILLLSLYPAPYRMELYNCFLGNFSADIFFEKYQGDGRDVQWFSRGDYQLINTKKGKKNYRKALKNLKDYSLVGLYEYSSKEAIKLILKCKRKKVPYVLNCDGVILTPHNNPLKNIVKRFLIKGAAAYLASGEYAKQYFLRYGAEAQRIYQHTFSTLHPRDILKEPISSEEKIQLRKELNLPIDKKIVIAVGRFISLKRYDILLSSWEKMSDEYTLLLIGGGEEKENYEKIIGCKHLKNVILKDFCVTESLYEYYKASDVFVHPTSYDVWGLVVNEAMANGLPVITTDKCVAGLELIREGENGYIVPVGDVESLCDRLNTIFANTENLGKMGQASLERIREYTIENMAKTHMEVFERIIKEKEERA